MYSISCSTITLILPPAYQMCVYMFVCVYVCIQEKLQSVTWESTELSNDIIKRKQMLAKIEQELHQAEEVCHQPKTNLDFELKWFKTDKNTWMNPLITANYSYRSLNSFPLLYSIHFSFSSGTFKGRDPKPKIAPSDGRLSSPWYHWVPAHQG